jgi:NADP-dependent 3-hydroxy acid dehydrogenase YdfG
MAIAVVTGASSGIGAATCRVLAAQGFRVWAAARRMDRLESLAAEHELIEAVQLDVTDPASVAALGALVDAEPGGIGLLVNNAGGALGTETVANADVADWRTMYETNVIGVVQVTQALLPALERSGNGHIVLISSTAGHYAYEGGGGYVAAKHAAATVAETLRLELNGKRIRISEIAPGLVHTEEFSLNRYKGDQGAADKVYADVDGPLTAHDIADIVGWVATRPPHVDIHRIIVRPTAQASVYKLHRGPLI